jgi:hypothetical protein
VQISEIFILNFIPPVGNHDVDLSQHPLLDMLCDAAYLLEIPAPFTGSRYLQFNTSMQQIYL